MRARVHGAVSVLNGTATGIGCSLPVVDGMEASWAWTDAPGLVWEGPGDDRVARACMETTGGGRGAAATTTTRWPPARGLKTSSQAAAALLAAALGKERLDAAELPTAVAIARRAGVTLTGAMDDTVAVATGTCHVVDNRNGTRLHAVDVPPCHVAIWVPHTPIAKECVRAVDASPARRGAEEALARLRGGDVAGAMAANHAAYFPLYRAHGLPVTEAPLHAALDAGALAASISGTGPAVAALFDAPAALPDVPGGTWAWTRTVTR